MLDSIYLMSTHSAVEEQLASIVDITYRHGIRIVVIPLKSQNPRSLLTKDTLALLLCQLLPITAHFPKHNLLLKCERLTFVEIQKFGLVHELIESLDIVRLRLQITILGLIELCDIGLAMLIFCTDQLKRRLGTGSRLLATQIFALSRNSI